MKTIFSALALLAVWLAVPSDAQATFPIFVRSAPVTVQVDPFSGSAVFLQDFGPVYVHTNRTFIHGFNSGFSGGVVIDPFGRRLDRFDFRQRDVFFVDRFGRLRVR